MNRRNLFYEQTRNLIGGVDAPRWFEIETNSEMRKLLIDGTLHNMSGVTVESKPELFFGDTDLDKDKEDIGYKVTVSVPRIDIIV